MAAVRVLYLLILGAVAMAVLILFSCGSLSPAYADPAPVDSRQPRPDVFPGSTAGQLLDVLNPLHSKVERTGIVNWAYKVEPGCSDVSQSGYRSIGDNIGAAMGDLFDNTNVRSVYVNGTSTKPDLTIRINCGASATAIGMSGGVIGCLCRGFPYNLDIDLIQDMRNFPNLSQMSIVHHEYSGHALATWNEQYCPGFDSRLGCSGKFATVPGWYDFMNTGEESRHLWSAVEANRWGRTHGTLPPQKYGLNTDQGYLWVCGISPKSVGIYVWGVGSVNFDQLARQPDGCYGLTVDPRYCYTFTVGNVVDWVRPEYRYDRSVCP